MFINWFFTLIFISAPLLAVAQEIVHIVKPGDQLMVISNQYYGTHQRWMEIADVNPAINPDSLITGQKLRIPDPASIEVDAFIQKQRLYKSIAKLKYEKSKLLLGAKKVKRSISSNKDLHSEREKLALQIAAERNTLATLRKERTTILAQSSTYQAPKFSQSKAQKSQLTSLVEAEKKNLNEIISRKATIENDIKRLDLKRKNLGEKLTQNRPTLVNDEKINALEEHRQDLNNKIEKERILLRDYQAKTTTSQETLQNIHSEISSLKEEKKLLISSINNTTITSNPGTNQKALSAIGEEYRKTHARATNAKNELKEILEKKEVLVSEASTLTKQIAKLHDQKINLSDLIKEDYDDASERLKSEQQVMLARENKDLTSLRKKNRALQKTLSDSREKLSDITEEYKDISGVLERERNELRQKLEADYQDKISDYQKTIDDRISQEKEVLTAKLEQELSIFKKQLMKNNQRTIAHAVTNEKQKLSQARNNAEDEASHYDRLYGDKIFLAKKNVVKKVADVQRKAQIEIDEAIENKEQTARQYLELKAKHDELESEFFSLKDAHNKNREELLSFQEKESDYKFWEEEKIVLTEQVSSTQRALDEKLKETNILENKIPFYRDSIVAKSQEQVIREKNRILSQRLWVEKNRDFQKCTLNFPDKDNLRRDTFKEMIVFLNETLGEKNILIDANSTELIIKLPGKVVYGVDNPKVNSKYNSIFYKLNNSLSQLPVEKIHVLGLSGYRTVRSEANKKVSAENYSLKQSIKLQNFFIDEMGWSPKKVSSGTLGYMEQRFSKTKKQFHLQIKFQSRTPRRSIASIKSDPALDQILDDISKELHEPKYSLFKFNNGMLEVHLARHYFFSNDEFKLTDAGKLKIDKLMKMFMNIDDSKLQVTWVPGQLEKDRAKNIKLALLGIDKFKTYIQSKYDWTNNNLEFQFENRHSAITEATTSRADRENRRLIFKLVPNRIALREANEL